MGPAPNSHHFPGNCTDLPLHWQTELTTDLPVSPGELTKLSCTNSDSDLLGDRFVRCLYQDKFAWKVEPRCEGTSAITSGFCLKNMITAVNSTSGCVESDLEFL